MPTQEKKHFSILVCIDGSEDSLRALKYAAKMGAGNNANLTLLYVRPVDQGLRTGGLQASLVRENMLNWGLELPGVRALNQAHDALVDLGFMSDDWDKEYRHVDVRGTELGDNLTIYRAEDGHTITLKLMVSPTVLRGILDECEMGEYDITIIGRSDEDQEGGVGTIGPAVAETVAVEHHGTVLVAHDLEENHGHLVCVRNSDVSIRAAKRNARIAARCACPIHLFAVASSDKQLDNAHEAIRRAKEAIEAEGLKISSDQVKVGDPTQTIIEEGRNYSVIVVSTAEVTGWRRFFTSSVTYKVLHGAYNSVMVVR